MIAIEKQPLIVGGMVRGRDPSEDLPEYLFSWSGDAKRPAVPARIL